MDRREALHIIAAEALQGQLAFPSHVQVALRVREVLDNPDCHIDEYSILVETEPVLSARVVAIANAARNASAKTLTDVRSAVVRIGMGTMRALAVAEVARHFANMPARPQDRVISMKLWSHSVHVAALAHVLAGKVTRQNPDTALFAGIVHELGALYLIYRARDFPCLLESRLRKAPSDALQGQSKKDSDMEESEHGVSRAIMQALAIPNAVVQVIEELWKGCMTLPPVTLGDTLLLADELAPIQSPLQRRLAGASPRNAIDVDTIIGAETLNQILERSAADVSSLAMALNS
ncbi:MAG: HDOD domain-containing protein [Pseudomonadota bacterium]